MLASVCGWPHVVAVLAVPWKKTLPAAVAGLSAEAKQKQWLMGTLVLAGGLMMMSAQ